MRLLFFRGDFVNKNTGIVDKMTCFAVKRFFCGICINFMKYERSALIYSKKIRKSEDYRVLTTDFRAKCINKCIQFCHFDIRFCVDSKGSTWYNSCYGFIL